MAFEGLRRVVYVGSSEHSLGHVPKAPLSKEAVRALGEAVLTKIIPENREHIRAAHRLDRDSAEAGLLTTEGKAELLSPEDFRDWTHPGDSKQNPWKQLDFIGERPYECTGFVNSYKMERGNKTALKEHGILTNPKATGEEIEWYVPEKIKPLEESAITKQMSDRFKQGTDYIVHWADAEDISADDRTLLKRLGFSEAYTDTYAGEDSASICFFVDRASFAQSLLEKMATK